MDEAQEARQRHGLPWDRVALTPLDDSDIDAVQGWQNDPAVRDLTMGFRLPVQKETVRDWIAGLRGPGQQNRIVYAIRHDGAAAGLIHLYDIAPFQRRATLGVLIGNPALRGQGIGHVATLLILDFAFRGLDLRKVGLEVLAGNTAAIRLYEGLGFVREGLKRQEYFADGHCWDSLVFGLLRAEFTTVLPPGARRLCLQLSAGG
jgi:RimJ/RimL family protein N-acetyltransferase